MKNVAFDTETFLIDADNIAPEIVCATFAQRDGQTLVARLISNGDDEKLLASINWLLQTEDVRIITARGAYDLACICRTFPELTPAVFAALEAGRVTDVQHRERLINLSTHGNLETALLPDGSSARISYSLADLELKYLGVDRSDQKDGDDIWRLNYYQLDGWESADYPKEAAEYALDDAKGTLLVYEAQEDFLAKRRSASVKTEYIQTYKDFALYLLTCWGAALDQERVEWIAKRVREERDPESIPLLIQNLMLTPGEPARPFKNGATNDDGTPKMKAPVKPAKKLAAIREHVVGLCGEHSIRVLLTEKGQSETRHKTMKADDPDLPMKYVSYEADFVKRVAFVTECPILAEFVRYQSLAKVADFVSACRGHATIHPHYNALLETGRTSSYRGKAVEKGGLYQGVHIQGQPRKIKEVVRPGQEPQGDIDVRLCYVPRPGRALWNADYGSIELVSVGQVTWEIFQDKKLCQHRALALMGVNFHTYLGAQLAYEFAKDDPGKEYQDHCRRASLDRMGRYEVLRAMKKYEQGTPEREFHDHWRLFAKPVGLGFPGGLGPAKMTEFARKQYDVNLTFPQAQEFRELWWEVYPEMPEYKHWVGHQTDPVNDCIGHDDDGEPIQGYWYRSPFGMVRRGASYCAVANGRAMQTPTAEGAAGIALPRVVRACYDPTQESVLYGCRPWGFIHDELIGETTEDESLWHDQAMEVSRIMCESMAIIMRDVPVTAEPLLCNAWSKDAEPTFDEAGRLIPWEPKD
jgi:hypothetical protein